jgi:two-component system KDP operon response regulator KdpE
VAKILVVDDETAIALLLEYYLDSGGHSVTAARSALGSMCWLEAEKFDVVLLDIMMPGPLNGLDVCRILKGDPQTAGTRVLVVSGVPGMEDRARQAGADAFLSKPFKLDEVASWVERLARQRSGTRLSTGVTIRNAIDQYSVVVGSDALGDS